MQCQNPWISNPAVVLKERSRTAGPSLDRVQTSLENIRQWADSHAVYRALARSNSLILSASRSPARAVSISVLGSDE